jgi:hypothetical protein
VTDGEPAYQAPVLESSHRVIHVQQYHAKAKLGQITINKYKKFGHHLLHYQIHTHWKIFTKRKRKFGFKWEIKFIQAPIQQHQGRPTKEEKTDPRYVRWKKFKSRYETDHFEKEGSAHITLNVETRKIGLRQGSRRWMKKILLQILPIFQWKCVTNNRSESKNAQIKQGGTTRKQPDLTYADQLVQLQEYVSQNHTLPEVTLQGRPLYNYIMQKEKWQRFVYKTGEPNSQIVQTVLSTYL